MGHVRPCPTNQAHGLTLFQFIINPWRMRQRVTVVCACVCVCVSVCHATLYQATWYVHTLKVRHHRILHERHSLQYYNSFFPSAIAAWNSLPSSVVSATSCPAFKQALCSPSFISWLLVSFCCTTYALYLRSVFHFLSSCIMVTCFVLAPCYSCIHCIYSRNYLLHTK